ncbi:MAG: protein kinase family protein, partial [Gammaproteobacteria bacterium]|nr:protein kinase family protein [Gammaproteobacteria bacterium]
YLKKQKLLTQTSLDHCVKLLFPPDKFCVNHFYHLMKILKKNNFLLTKEQLETIILLSDLNRQRLLTLVSHLIIAKLLSKDSFAMALMRITEKLPVAIKAKVQAKKNQQNKTFSLLSDIKLNNDALFFTKPKLKAKKGGYGKVYQGFNSPHANEPCCAIKKLIKTDERLADREAIREVKYHRLFQRQAFYFSTNSATYVISEWQRDKNLSKFSPRKIQKIPFEKRLHCLRSVLSELNILHAHYRIHNDIKCENIILDIENTCMKLIDFGTAHKKDSLKLFGRTSAYKDPHQVGDHFAKDVYAMGLVIMHLFPEIFSVVFTENKTEVYIFEKTFSLQEQSMIALIHAMMHENLKLRCTSKDALDYCDQLIGQVNHLDETILAEIQKTSIQRSLITVEDVLRGARSHCSI